MQYVVLITIYTCISLFKNCNSTVNKTSHIILEVIRKLICGRQLFYKSTEGFGCIVSFIVPFTSFIIIFPFVVQRFSICLVFRSCLAW